MKIIVDGFGGDNSPLEIIKGCALAVKEFDNVEIAITGDEQIIKQVAKENDISLDKFSITHAPLVMPVEEDPTEVLKSYENSSLTVGLKMLASGEGDAYVSAGSTGAVVVGATLIVKRIKGIKRAAIATVMPSEKGCVMLLDSGANSECRPEMLEQFGVMGSIYMNKVMGIDSPKVGLANIGAERTKGTPMYVDSYDLLERAPINFVGNAEGRYIFSGNYDVIVADGFTGNIILKLTEGVAMFLTGKIKKVFLKGIVTKLAALMVKSGLRSFKKDMDYTEYGGSVLLGISKPVIKAHGSSNAKAIKNAIRQAVNFAKSGTTDALSDEMIKIREKNKG